MLDYLIRGRFSPLRDVFVSEGFLLHAPSLCDVEVAAALRRLMTSDGMSQERAAEALRDYLDLPLQRHGHESLLERVLQLRENFSAYDATYIALAEKLTARFATLDSGLRRAAQAHLDVELV